MIRREPDEPYRPGVAELGAVAVAILAGVLAGGAYRISVMCAVLAAYLVYNLVREGGWWTALVTIGVVALGVAAFPWRTLPDRAGDDRPPDRSLPEQEARHAAVDARVRQQTRDAQLALGLRHR